MRRHAGIMARPAAGQPPTITILAARLLGTLARSPAINPALIEPGFFFAYLPFSLDKRGHLWLRGKRRG